jgi:choline kinase
MTTPLSGATAPTDIVILAAGIGSRLRPVTDLVPKCLVPVSGKSILERLLAQLADHANQMGGFRVHVVAGYLADKVARVITASPVPVHLIVNEAYLTTNNMFSLSLAAKHLVANGELVIMNGDCVYEDAIISQVLQTPGSFILTDSSQFNEEAMKVSVVDGNIRNMSKALPKASGNVVSIDLYRFAPPALTPLMATVREIIAAQRLTEWTEVAIQELVADPAIAIRALSIGDRRWMEIDTLADLAEAERLFPA